MTEYAPLTIRRILVALDASPGSLAALRAAAELAAQTEAELLGLFVEDVGILRVAGAPFAREILLPSAVEVPVTRTSMEFSLRAQSNRMKQTLATAAEQAHLTWQFRVVRGRVTEEILAAAAEADLIAIGSVGWSIGSQARLGSTAQELVASSVPVLLLPRRPVSSPFHLVAYFDDTPGARRALLGAAQLAEVCKRSLTVLIVGTVQGSAQRMRREAEAALGGRTIETRYRQIDPGDEASLRRVLEAERGGILVLGGRHLSRTLESLAREGNIPLLLLDHH